MNSELRTHPYNPGEIEPRWQARWEELGLHTADLHASDKPKFYLLTMYPYPSGDLHIGHWSIIAPTDVAGRFKRMHGYNVFFPFGFDAFGLPAENAAIKGGIHPRDWTYGNIATMRRQVKLIGAALDWSKELITADPSYYRWNQWLFLRFMEQGLAYRQMAPVDWCPKDLVVLAREQVLGADRVCWRCGTQVIKRDLEQWFFRTTKYADELLSYQGLRYPEPLKVMQTNWIGRSEGAEISFKVADQSGAEIRVFTTRPDTLFGATFMVLAPEHPLVDALTHPDNKAEVEAYRFEARRKSEIDRLSTDREKTGVALGAQAVNPISGERIPIWIADYVLSTYGTGAIMAVPAHDERDFEFAQRFSLPIRVVVASTDVVPDMMDTAFVAHTPDEVLVNSGDFSGMPAPEGAKAITAKLEGAGQGKSAVTYRLRDWLVSRQRGWGAPIPVVYCEEDPSCGMVAVPDDQLPITLPDDIEKWPAQGNPLETHATWKHTSCPSCSGKGRRETDTMDTFVDSSWYWWRYLDPTKEDGPVDRALNEAWCPVEQYTGGAEHAVLHLMYARFFAKALNDLGLVHEREPWKRLFNQGQILGEDGERMSKSRGNVQDPDALVARYGADTVRLFLMFMKPWAADAPWNAKGIEGVSRFLRRLWTVTTDPMGKEPGDAESGRLPAGLTAEQTADDLRRMAHRTLKRVTDDHAEFGWNTMVSALMELNNKLVRLRGSEIAGGDAWDETVRLTLLMLAPMAPHFAEELWSRRLAARGEEWASIHTQRWPEYDPALVATDQVELPVQVNGKLRDMITVATGTPAAQIESLVLGREKVRGYLEDAEVVRVIQVPDRLVNVVTKPK
ncbi:MAG: leucyl-tRNA synthetase [Chloroflexota bacterium]|jgi:leucyl-tRNA synthetase|nr:leucyl-tRNA synthetase [Chloroflexota bacterium]